MKPPRLADQLLILFCAPHRLEEVQGDLHEEFVYQVQRIGERRARWRYWQDVLSFIKPFAVKRRFALHRYNDSLVTPFLSHAMLRNYLKIAFRNLVKNKVYSFINIGGLALSIGCCLLIALYIYDEWSYDRFHRNAPNVYRIVEKQTQADGLFDVATTPGPLAPTLKKDFPEVVETGRLGRWSGLMKHGKQTFEENNLFFADNGLLRIFDFPLVRGNRATALTRPDELVITETTARKYFGINWPQNPNVIGAVLRLNNERDYRIAGVLKDLPTNSTLQFDMLLSFRNVELFDKWGYQWNSNNYHTYVQLQPGTNVTTFDQKLKRQYIRYFPETKTTLQLQPLTAVHLYSNFAFNTDWGPQGSIFYVRLFGVVGLIILLIACINFINLATARSVRRAREVGVRKTIGAFRWHLVIQFLGESFLLTSLAVCLGLVFASVLTPVFNQLSGKQLTLDYSAPVLWLILGSLTILVAILAGLYPAFLLSSFQPIKVLKGTFSGQTGRLFRQTLVVSQFGLSIVLIVCTLFIYRQLQYMQQKNLGFDKSQLLYVRMGGELKKKAAQFKQELLQQSSIKAVAATTATLVDIANGSDIEWEGQSQKSDFSITQMNVDPDFLTTTGMKLARGSNFRQKAVTDTNWTYLVNETAARRMGFTNQTVLGKRVKFWGMTGPVTGVVRDFHFRPLNVPIEPFIFRYGPGDFYFQMLVRTQPGRTQEAIQRISERYNQFEKQAPLQYGFVDQELDKQYRTEQRTGQIVLYFSGLAILISCLGLFGLVAYTAEQRTKEIGVRKVLGASIANIVTLLSGNFLKLVSIAIGIGSPLAWYVTHRWLQNFAYRITIDWWVFALAGLLAVGIALLTISFQSIKAALVNPVESLRSE